MTAAQLAEVLRTAHPDVDPLEIGVDELLAWATDAGADSPDDGLLAEAVVAWAELVA